MFPSTIHSPFSLPPSSTNPDLVTRNPKRWPSPELRGRRLRCPCRRRGSSWDPNAESVRSGRFEFREEEAGGGGDYESTRKRRWWSDGLDQEIDPFEDDVDDDLENPWDRIWIFKVLKSYGYLLPAIIASMLLTSGAKAFLLALALPLGQSALSLAFDKVWGKGTSGEGPATKYKAKWDPPGFRKTSGGSKGYQTWVEADESADGSLGGWDDLDREREARRRRRETVKAEPAKKGRLYKGGGRHKGGGGVPLLLRLLIAVFPFLASWTKIL